MNVERSLSFNFARMDAIHANNPNNQSDDNLIINHNNSSLQRSEEFEAFTETLKELNVEYLDIPPYSLDLYIIENVCGKVERKLQESFSSEKNIVGDEG